jgi:Ca2+-binding RTX toxin-like protein
MSYSLGANLENLSLTGSADISGIGNSLDNTMSGNNASNSMFGGTGNDSINGGAGNDTFNGGAGNDSFIGGVGLDWAHYGSATQNLVINLGTGIATGVGTDVLSGIEYVIAGSGADNIIGDSLNNSLSGGAGNDTFNGGAGNDSLNGGDGKDTLYGSSNTSNGGKGEIDKISGGVGTDLFVLGTAATGRFYDDGSVSNGGRRDYALITDFTTGSDQLQLKGVASNYFLGASGVTGVTGSGVFYDSNNNRSLDLTDELMAILQSGNSNALTASNTINMARFV